MHQPNYLPWLGLFGKVALADTFIIYDTAQYTANSVINRNKVRTPNGWCYLTVPVNRRYYESRIMDVPMPDDRKWQEVHWKTISQNYAKTAFFREYQAFFQSLYQDKLEYLWQLNEKILLFLLECLGIKVEVLKASQLRVSPELKKTDAIIACMKSAGAGVYLSGPSGRAYLEPEKFLQNNIGLKFFKFQHPVYQQRYPGFEPNLSAIDLLFMMGPKAGEIIRSSGRIED